MARGLIGGSKGGRTGNRNFKGGGTTPPGVDMLNPAASGNPDVVQQRAAQATKGVMQSKQLRKNKSTGIKI